MAVDSKHPLYSEHVDDYEQLRDTYDGEKAVKDKGRQYLPPTSGMVMDGMMNERSPGHKAYIAYKTRAVVPDMMKDAVDAMLGVMHHKPATIELPAAMEPLREVATLRNESLDMLLRRINEEQLITGRLGLLTDIPKTPSRSDFGVQAGGTTRTASDLPYIALYEAEDIINWDDGRRDGIEVQNLNLVILDETEFERNNDFEWEEQKKYRVLVLGDTDVNEPIGDGIYRVGTFRDVDTAFTEENMIEPSFRGNTLDTIPFTFINSSDIVPDPDNPPLLGLSNLILTIYRGEADYRQALFAQAQDTLVVIGGGELEGDVRIGAGGRLDLPMGASAEFIGVDSKGLVEQRTSLENDYARAAQKGGQLMDSVSRERESGDALKVRVAARTATLNQIALAGAFGLQHTLRQIATWIGANPEEVVVTANLDFIDDSFNPEELVKLISARNLGAPISMESIHLWLQSKDITEMDFEEEVAKIEEEELLGVGSQAAEDLPEDDPAEEDEDEEVVDDV